MQLPFVIYVLDTETTSLSANEGEIIELSIYRLNDDKQQTWCIKPKNYAAISPDSLRINKHKLEDLKHQTEFGRATYKEMAEVLPLVENFFLEDGEDANNRILAGQNIQFDLNFLMEMWKRENTIETFPFGNRPKLLDTMQLALFLDIVNGEKSEYYNLKTLIAKYAIKNSKAHSAKSDTLATKELLLAQIHSVQKSIKDGAKINAKIEELEDKVKYLESKETMRQMEE